jgi:hypothetical protein
VTLTTQQAATYQGKDWWQWSVWLESTEQELDEVRRVTYHLHSTFPKPERVVEDRATKFRLRSAGWGEFTLRLVVEKKNGEQVVLHHNLQLDYPAWADADAPQRGAGPPQRVFLSYSSTDERMADNIHRFLGSHGIEVLDPADLLRPGQNLSADIEIELRKADCLIALISDRSGRSVMSEIDAALKNRTPVVAVELTDTHPSLPSEVLRLTLREGSDVEGISETFLQTIRTASRKR